MLTMKYTRKIKKEEQIHGWLNTYGSAYPGSDIVNTRLTKFKRISSSLIRNLANQVEWVAEKKYNRH